MTKFSERKILPHDAKKIFDLVMDIEKYPEFLPWCKQARVIERISDDNLHADLLISFKGFFEKYRSDVKYFQDSFGIYHVETRAIQGPFKNLFSLWKIKQLEQNQCEIEFFLEFEFNSFILQKMIGLIFEKASQKMIESFEKRARES